MKIKQIFIVVGGLSALSMASQAMAADGCKFMLCMGAADPMGIAECKPVIKEVLHDLSKGKPFPTCTMSDGRDSRQSGSYVNYGVATLTPRCPAGTKQGQDGVVYHSGLMPTNIRKSMITGYQNVPTGFTNELADNDLLRKGDKYSQRICLGGSQTGSLSAARYTGGEAMPAHKWYQSMQVMKPDGASYEFNFFVDNKLFSTHRF